MTTTPDRGAHLADRVVIVTGASSGIGAATATALAAAGAKIVLAARNPDKLDDLLTTIAAGGGTAVARVTDVTDADDVLGLAQFARTEYGHIDALVNNAGLMLFSAWADVALDDWNSMIDTNIRGYLHAIRAVLPEMLERGSGHILNMSSVAGIHVGDTSGVYSATKFFIRGITDSLRQEVGVDKGIQISMVSPGVIDTGWTDKVSSDGGREVAERVNADAITAERVASAVLYALDQPADVTVNDIVIHPTKQPW
ncbi:SDR family oxidoreductase [Nocardioides alkalitolerans]|uniref:SDR family oxidoreductase n=1 Tax=Nocardioides alkalitolerans TaxID=281714 RepID=UPI00041E3217|nr:SDR family oxidoreductase [Nocardioides alkalitolerans]